TTYKDSIAWEFVVQKSPVRWSGGDITVTKELGEPVTITRQLVNNSGFPNPYHLHNIPSWMGVSSTNGIVPNLGNVPIEFTFGPNLGYGSYDVTVTDSTIYGDQPLRIHINVLCHSPNWVVNESMFQYSMNIVGKLYIDTAASINPNDLVGVFVGQELRGSARLKQLNANTFRVFLTVYSNIENGEQLQMRVWDSSLCNEFGQVIEQFTFASNSVLGTVNNPVTITATNQTIQQYSMKSGWTWLSFNTESADMSVSNVLSGLSPSPNDIVKDQTSFAQYVNNDVWFGSLDTIRNTKMYLLKLSNKDSLNHVGYPVPPGINPIVINAGWNYIGYLPQANLDVNTALSSLNAQNGDLIKSQFSFAIFDSVFGWVGDLTQMKPKLGYFIKLGHIDTLLYPSGAAPAAALILAEDASQKFIPGQPEWMLNINRYQYSMNAVAVLANGIIDSIGTETALGLFKDNECRGMVQAVYSDLAKAYVFYLSAYSNKAVNDSLSIKVYNGYTKTVVTVPGTMVFEADRIYGTLKEPLTITNDPLGASAAKLLPVEFSLSQNYPNPFNPSTTIGFAVPVETDVEIIIYNIMGEKVKQIVGEHKQAGFYSVVWDGRNDYSDVVSSGIYIYSMKAGNYQSTKKLTFLK
ncbi:MAG: T9SS type A sorting domain-containing protein, partial [Ignavibacteriales bacterium]|nr:T9SS type A sorting domain-containing protein [Ignavibacteriales bacterium]